MQTMQNIKKTIKKQLSNSFVDITILAQKYDTQFCSFLLNLKCEQEVLKIMTHIGLQYCVENMLENFAPLDLKFVYIQSISRANQCCDLDFVSREYFCFFLNHYVLVIP